MKELLEKRLNLILIGIIIGVAILVAIPVLLTQGTTPLEDYTYETVALTEPSSATETVTEAIEEQLESEVIKVTAKSDKGKDEKSKATEQKATATKSTEATEETTIEIDPKVYLRYATAPKVANPASYDAQWNAGYLVAIDNPDKNYKCPHIELTDENRDLLERLCMGEFGSGGFTGAALIAQAVKNAMYTYGIDDVATVIKRLRYDGKTNTPGDTAVKKAVVYVFDMDKDAIQHRILYMYNPKITQTGISTFHESRKYICTYKDVRFFDK